MTAALSSGRIAIDTGPLIYFLSGDATRAPVVRRLLAAASRGEAQIVLSAISEAELLVAPLRQPDPDEATAVVHDLLAGPPVMDVREVTRAIARRAAWIRASWNLRLADALVAATAFESGCNSLLGNDGAFRRLSLEGLTYHHLDDLVD